MKLTKNILIIGGSGFLGSHLARRLSQVFKVSATYYGHPLRIPGVNFFPLDISNRNWVKRLIYSIKPDVIIYAAGSNSLDWCEQHSLIADRLHSSGLANMISYLDVIQPKLIYLSNCYVFDGFRGNYKENDTLLPGSALGRIKASAESSIRNRCLNYVIVRSPPLLGRGLIFHTSLFDQWRDRLSREVTVDASVQEIHSFSLVDAFCDFMQTLINANVKNRVLHFSGHTKLSTFDLAVRFARTFNLPETLIIPKKLSLSQANSSSSTKSEITFTFDFSLNCSQSIELLNLKPLLIEEALKQLKEKLA